MPAAQGPFDEAKPNDSTELIEPVPDVVDVSKPLPIFVPGSPPLAEPEEVEDQVDPEEASRRRRSMLWFTLTVLVIAAAAVVLALWAFQRLLNAPFEDTPNAQRQVVHSITPSASADPTPHDPVSSAAAPILTMSAKEEVWDKETVALHPVFVTASCQAEIALDAGGNVISYEPDLMFDGNPSTAWRCDGSGVGQTITVALPEGSRIAELGIVNGYAKTDPVSHEDRYQQYRRITKVTWVLPNGKLLAQRLDPNTREIQRIRPPMTAGNNVTLRIDSVTDPGTRDAVFISELVVAGPKD